MKYYVGDIIKPKLTYGDEQYFKVSRITKTYYETKGRLGYGPLKTFIKANSHETMELVKRGFSETLKKL